MFFHKKEINLVLFCVEFLCFYLFFISTPGWSQIFICKIYVLDRGYSLEI